MASRLWDCERHPELAVVLKEAAVVEKIVHGTIYRLAGGGRALVVEAMEEAQEGTGPMGVFTRQCRPVA